MHIGNRTTNLFLEKEMRRDNMTTILVNGKPVTKEEIKHIEINNDIVKRIFSQKLAKK